MPAANVSYFGNLCAVKITRAGKPGIMRGLKPCKGDLVVQDVAILMIAIIFVGMVVYPAGPEIH